MTSDAPYGSEVTDIDIAVEELVRDEPARYVREDGVHGEERAGRKNSSPPCTARCS
ncbi:hypothetical protein [Streptomyces chrestomyceticus]|uniref:hypothetical protein n=1 Tax=Streptomyces chrestomyceticus TaxID=68185 RepID=UPI0019D2E9AF|nr:hypothetical protein [Streptomyces chrestomyceticus]